MCRRHVCRTHSSRWTGLYLLIPSHPAQFPPFMPRAQDSFLRMDGSVPSHPLPSCPVPSLHAAVCAGLVPQDGRVCTFSTPPILPSSLPSCRVRRTRSSRWTGLYLLIPSHPAQFPPFMPPCAQDSFFKMDGSVPSHPLPSCPVPSLHAACAGLIPQDGRVCTFSSPPILPSSLPSCRRVRRTRSSRWTGLYLLIPSHPAQFPPFMPRAAVCPGLIPQDGRVCTFSSPPILPSSLPSCHVCRTHSSRWTGLYLLIPSRPAQFPPFMPSAAVCPGLVPQDGRVCTFSSPPILPSIPPFTPRAAVCAGLVPQDGRVGAFARDVPRRARAHRRLPRPRDAQHRHDVQRAVGRQPRHRRAPAHRPRARRRRGGLPVSRRLHRTLLPGRTTGLTGRTTGLTGRTAGLMGRAAGLMGRSTMHSQERSLLTDIVNWNLVNREKHSARCPR